MEYDYEDECRLRLAVAHVARPYDLVFPSGLQRERFLPTIHAINQFTTVLHLSISHDYRLRHLHKAGIYYTPLNKKTLTSFNSGQSRPQRSSRGRRVNLLVEQAAGLALAVVG